MKKGKKWYKSFSNWLVMIACIILIPVLIANVCIIFQSKTDKSKVPNVLGYKPFIVLSGSMEGKIHKGDLIITKIVDPTTLGVDDIIAFRDAEGTVTTHRIIDVVETNGVRQFITKGDNNNTQDSNLVNLADVEGIYVARIAGFGSMMKSLSEPMTIMALAVLITVIFGIGFVISVQKDKKIEREEFLKYKMMKEYEEQQRERELQRLKQKQESDFSNNELLELLRSKEQEKKTRYKDDFDDKFKF